MEELTDISTASDSKALNGRVWALVVAAGRGARFGGERPKQYAQLDGTSLVVHSLNALCQHPSVHAVLVGLAPADAQFSQLAYTHTRFAGRFDGGDERFVTVMRGLEAIIARGGGDDWVLVHDAARPLVSVVEIDTLLAALRPDQGVDGAVLALPATDAMKRVDKDGRAIDVVDRERLWRALTPQGFRCGQLLSALRACVNSQQMPLDECEAMQRQGIHAVMVPGRNTNLKITTREDLALAHAITAMRRSELNTTDDEENE